jgi:exopolysaccharide production protein ExoQ
MMQGTPSRISEANRARSYDTRQSRGASPTALSGPNPKTMIDRFAIMPLLACGFALIGSPLSGYFMPTDYHSKMNGDASLVPRLFWPFMAAISILLIVQHRSRFGKLTWPPHIICLLAYLGFAGASVLWAFSPQSASIRFAQQVMIFTSIVLPVMLAPPTADMMRGLFLCFALASILNVFFVLNGAVDTVNCSASAFCYQGYFGGKNYLGECVAVAFLLSLYEIVHRGWRRALGVIVLVVAIVLIFLSDSKTALGLVIISPLLARLTLGIRSITRVSPAIILLSLPFFYIIVSTVSHVDLMGRMAFTLYHDSTLTGRTIIWEFAQHEIDRRPLLGWGYQSFWLVPGSPAYTEAPGWVRMMPNAHNGYYDTTLEMGRIGLAFLYVFIIATLHGIGRVADRDLARARHLLSLVLFFVMWNYFESLWMRGFEFLWVMFLILAAEIARYWRIAPLSAAAYRLRRRPASEPMSVYPGS